MWARAEKVTGIKGITAGFYDYYDAASAFGACAYHSRYALYEGYQTGSEDGKPVAPLMGHMQGFDGGAGDSYQQLGQRRKRIARPGQPLDVAQHLATGTSR